MGRGVGAPLVRRESRDSFRQSRPKSMPNLDDAKMQSDSESMRNSSSIGNVIATSGETTEDRRSLDTGDMRHSMPDSTPFSRLPDTGKAK